ncbi:MAG: hypothetical protein NZM44_02985 [Candidatus Calescibacterium sp.]|nr:hypothetical protein [Candidatus Calescibacterium sp.]MCS7243555.1 hypothetical protein [Candidatus Calescibacterium sp.]MCX7758282.1 hypothetical protein [bacterium]MDW8132473.1 hypothetical protein [Candidatus Calescibacterium sp.]
MRTLDKLEEIAQEVMDLLIGYKLDEEEAFYILGYIERSLYIQLLEKTLEEYGLIESEEEIENEDEK